MIDTIHFIIYDPVGVHVEEDDISFDTEQCIFIENENLYSINELLRSHRNYYRINFIYKDGELLYRLLSKLKLYYKNFPSWIGINNKFVVVECLDTYLQEQISKRIKNFKI